MSISYRRSLTVQLFLLAALCTQTFAQVTSLEKQTDKMARLAVDYLNRNQPDSAYLLMGKTIKLALPEATWSATYKNQIAAILPFKNIIFINSTDSINKYRLESAVTLNFYASLDKSGKMKTFLFVPYQEEVKAKEMTAAERKTDTLARKILAVVNRKEVDSIYLMAGDYLKTQISATNWHKQVTGVLTPLAPFPEAVFVNSNQGVNKYRLNQYQYIFGSLDEQGKFNTIAIQPYTEDAVKIEKALTDNPLSTAFDRGVDRGLSAYIQTKGNVGLSVGILYKGKTYYYNYGETKLGTGKLPTRHTLYDIGSITKTFTSTLLAIAVDQHKITLETRIVNYLPDSVASNPALKNITFRQLSNHTSGFPRMPDNFNSPQTDPAQPYEHYSLNAMYSFLKHYKAEKQAGAVYEYSNYGAGLLGVLLEKVYHKSYPQLIHQYITAPAGLRETFFSSDVFDHILLAQGYNEDNKPDAAWILAPAFRAAGDIKSSAADMLAYAQLQLNTPNHTLNSALKLTHHVTVNDGINLVGLGWHYSADDKTVLQHGGGTGGFRSMVCVDLEKHIAVAILTNNASTGDALGLKLMKALKAIKDE